MTASRTSRSIEEIASRITHLRALIVSGFALRTLSLHIPRENNPEGDRSGDLAGHGKSDRC